MTEPTGPLNSVWPTGAHTPTEQLVDRRYVERSRSDSGLMPPAIAEYAITALTRPGDIVLDPDCGAGTTIVEALRAGRHAIGLTNRPRWWRIARANVTAAKAAGAGPDGMVLVLNRRTTTITAAETAGLTGRVALVLTTLRTTPADADERLRDLLAEARPLIRPGGHVVITSRPVRDPITHELTAGLHHILTAGTAAGFVPIARCVALTADLLGHTVTPHPNTDQQRSATWLHTFSAHHMAVVFRADPDAVDTAIAVSPPPRATTRRTSRTGLPASVAA